MKPLKPVPIEEIRSARHRISDSTIRTPLLRFNYDGLRAQNTEIYLKLENLQPSGAFKLRGAVNAIKLADPVKLDKGVWTASSGNMALAVATAASNFGLDCTAVVADITPKAKLEAIEKLGSKIIKVPWLKILEIARVHSLSGMQGLFIHPFSNPDVMAGNATVGLEIVEDLPDVNVVLVPYGGGGFAASVASAVKYIKPNTRVYAAEVEFGAAFSASLAAGKPVEIEHPPSFVSGIGSPHVFEDVWPLVKNILDGSIVSSMEETAKAGKLIAERARVVAEGAGAASVAGALFDETLQGKVVAVVSGGNIDSDKFANILSDKAP